VIRLLPIISEVTFKLSSQTSQLTQFKFHSMQLQIKLEQNSLKNILIWKQLLEYLMLVQTTIMKDHSNSYSVVKFLTLNSKTLIFGVKAQQLQIQLLGLQMTFGGCQFLMSLFTKKLTQLKLSWLQMVKRVFVWLMLVTLNMLITLKQRSPHFQEQILQ